MNVLGMFARHPSPGQTKTRLAATLDDAAAARLYAAFLEDLLSRCCGLADRFVVAATPQNEATLNWFQQRLRSRDLLVWQPEGSLGDRIEWFFNTTVGNSGERVVLIGSDSPDLPSAIIDDAFRKLDTADVVIAPAADGGFVLIGLRIPAAGLFKEIAFSSSTTLAETVAAVRHRGHTLDLLQPWYDIDTADDLMRFCLEQQPGEEQGEKCPRTQAALAALPKEFRERLKL